MIRFNPIPSSLQPAFGLMLSAALALTWISGPGCAAPVRSPARAKANDPVLDADCAALVPYYQKLPPLRVCSFSTRAQEVPVLRASLETGASAEVENFLALPAPQLTKLQRYPRRMRVLTRLGSQRKKALLEALAARDADAYRAASPELWNVRAHLLALHHDVTTACGKAFGNGPVAREFIEAAIRTKIPDFRACYGRGLAKETDLTGRVTVRWWVDEEGSVLAVRAEDERLSLYDCFADADASAFFAEMGHEPRALAQGTSLPDRDAIECVLHHCRSLSFPRSSGGTWSFTSSLDFVATPRRRTAATRW